MTSVSIGIPVYNGAGLVERAIESALSQSYGNFELVISDNASTDGTGEICRRYAEKDSRIKYFRRPNHGCAEENVLNVLKHCSGDYCMFLGHDDELAPDYARELAALLDGNPSAVLAGCGVLYQKKGGQFSEIRFAGTNDVQRLGLVGRALMFATGRSFRRSFRKPNLFVVGLFRRSVFLGIWNDHMGRFFSERDILFETALAGDILYCDRVLFTKHTTSRSHMERNPNDPLTLRKVRISEHPSRHVFSLSWRLLKSPYIPALRKTLIFIVMPWLLARRFGINRKLQPASSGLKRKGAPTKSGA